jgi:hypothetical protein
MVQRIASSTSAAFACCCLVAAVAVLAVATREEPGLAAASNHNRYDNDRDGLTDLQEQVIGTLPYRADTDGDGYSDLEERARGSDPLNPVWIPEDAEFSLGSCASQENGFVSVVSAVYLNDIALADVGYEIGFVYRGTVFRMSPQAQDFSRAFFRPGHDPLDTLVVVEVGLPESIVHNLGQVTMFSVLRDLGPGGVDPVVSMMTLRSIGGVVVSVEQTAAHASNNIGSATGVVYRPLAADDQIPSDWEGGKMCFLRTSALGMAGVSIQHEVDGAFCLPTDTYCNPVNCSSAIGTSVQLPDPGALAGG